ncbi:hypothetical protein [Alcanivorax sp.]|uniref:hypothetical protein n=1 Tax=Alcanivorax sp. TaxID=1872427 RepID=UPI0032D973E1
MKVAIKACLAAVTILALNGCNTLNALTGLPYNEGNGYKIDHDRNIYSGGVHIEYKDKSLLESEKRAEMENKMASEQQTQDAISRLPEGGKIIVHYEQLTIEAANTEWLEYVIMVDGKEIYRKQGTDDIANRPTSYSGGIGYWWNTDVVNLRQPVSFPFDFVVISNLATKRDTFTISAPKQ